MGRGVSTVSSRSVGDHSLKADVTQLTMQWHANADVAARTSSRNRGEAVRKTPNTHSRILAFVVSAGIAPVLHDMHVMTVKDDPQDDD